MNKKILTISIAAYNVEKYLENTLNSLIVSNEYMNKMEIVIVNDGSKDNTELIARRYEEKYPDTFIVVSKENGGYGSTINSSLKIAKGKYYKLLDGDDWFDTNTIPGFLNYLEQVESDIVVAPYFSVTQEEILTDRHVSLSEEKIDFVSAAIERNLQMHEIAVKTEILQKNNVKITENCFYTDEEFVFNALVYANSISRFEQPVYCYRLGLDGQSVSLTGIRKHYKDLLVVSDKMYTLFENNHVNAIGTKKRLFEQVVEVFTYTTYRAFLLLENPNEEKSILMKHDKVIKEKYPVIYQISNRSTMIKLIRKFGFRNYKFFCKMALKKYLKMQ